MYISPIQMLKEIREEKQRIDEAILVLERLASGGKRRRGRPPRWMQDLKRKPAASQTGSASEAARA